MSLNETVQGKNLLDEMYFKKGTFPEEAFLEKKFGKEALEQFSKDKNMIRRIFSKERLPLTKYNFLLEGEKGDHVFTKYIKPRANKIYFDASKAKKLAKNKRCVEAIKVIVEDDLDSNVIGIERKKNMTVLRIFEALGSMEKQEFSEMLLKEIKAVISHSNASIEEDENLMYMLDFNACTYENLQLDIINKTADIVDFFQDDLIRIKGKEKKFYRTVNTEKMDAKNKVMHEQFYITNNLNRQLYKNFLNECHFVSNVTKYGSYEAMPEHIRNKRLEFNINTLKLEDCTENLESSKYPFINEKLEELKKQKELFGNSNVENYIEEVIPVGNYVPELREEVFEVIVEGGLEAAK